MKIFSSFKSAAESKFYGLFWVVIMIFGGHHSFVESAVDVTELVDIIEFHTKYFHFTDGVPFYCSRKIKSVNKIFQRF